MSLPRIVPLLLIVWTASPARPASAQNRPPELSRLETRREVARHLEAGTRLVRDRSWAAALRELEAANQLRPDPRTLVLIAQCHEGLGHADLAATFYEKTLVEGGLDARERAVAETAIHRLQSRLHALTVRTTLTGAEISVDNRVAGRAPLGGRLFVAPGPHRLEARMMGQRPVPVEVTAVAGGASTVQLEARPASTLGTLIVDSVPSGLTVEIDGWDAGETPIRTQLEAGEHRVVLVRSGYRNQERVVRLAAETEEQLAFRSTARDELPRPAKLHVVSTAAGTPLRVDREGWRRLGTSAEELELEPGRHRFAIRGVRGRIETRQIDVRAGDRFLLRALPGRIDPGLPSELRWAGIVTTGALVAGAGLTGLIALLQHSTFDDNATRIEHGQYSSPTDLARLQSDARDARDTGEALSTLSDVLLIAGGVAATATLGVWVFGQGGITPPRLEVEGERGP